MAAIEIDWLQAEDGEYITFEDGTWWAIDAASGDESEVYSPQSTGTVNSPQSTGTVNSPQSTGTVNSPQSTGTVHSPQSTGTVK